MGKHKLYRHFENTSPLTSSLCKEISPLGDVGPSTSDTVALVRRTVNKSMNGENSGNGERVSLEKSNSSLFDCLPEGNCVSDSDSDEFFGNSSKTGMKLPYSAKEDEWILKYVLKGQNIFKVGSISLWRHLETKKENPKRTYQSLKNRFLRCIRPHIFTKYGHLITSAAETERILAKFPELKSKVGRTNTLSRLQLPVRKPNSNFAEGPLESRGREEAEKVASPSDSVRRERISNVDDFSWTNFSKFERKVTIRDKSLAVSVYFNSKDQLHKPVIPPARIYETFKKFKKKNKLILCSACGRYNVPKKDNLSSSNGDERKLNSSAGRRAVVPNSSPADPEEPSLQNSGSPPPKSRRMGEWDLRPCSPLGSPSTRDAAEKLGAPVGWGIPEEPLEPMEPVEPVETDRGPETSRAVASRREGDSAAAELLRETDDDLDSTYEMTMTDFKKLIKNEEERLLVKRCLYGKTGVLGLSDSISQMSMESYFVELSPNLETPELTMDYSNRSPTHNGERDNPSSLLARNMMKMLEEKKKSLES